jgi:hypothetical protein
MYIKSFLVIIFLAAFIAQAQEIKVTRTRKVTPDKTGEFLVSGVSPDGRFLLIARPGSKESYLMDPANGKTSMITPSPGANDEPGGYSDSIRVQLEELTPVLFKNGEKRIIKPGGEGSYIWVSLSPDKTRILYYLVGEGTGICDLEGKKQASTGNLHAPKWLNNEIVIGMDDRDDGHRILSSEIVAWVYSDDRKITLTSTGNRNEMYPYPFAEGEKIACTSTDGEIFLMSIQVK